MKKAKAPEELPRVFSLRMPQTMGATCRRAQQQEGWRPKGAALEAKGRYTPQPFLKQNGVGGFWELGCEPETGGL